MTVYAEQILLDTQQDQLFVQFFQDNSEFDPSAQIRHFDWFDRHLLTYQPVTSINAPNDDSGFFHVNFVGDTDPRLEKYSSLFEDDSGRSLDPNSYQMLLWSYQGWVEKNGPEDFARHKAASSV